jgi:ABC-type phosphate transport system substrate-binding protein
LLVVAVAVGCVLGIVLPANAYSHDDRVEFIRGQGSDSTYDLMQRLDSAFNQTQGCLTQPSTGTTPTNSTCAQENNPTYVEENHDHDVAISMYPVGSSNGIKILKGYGQPGFTKIDYARSSRATKAGDGVNLRFVAYAEDATPWGNFREGVGDTTSPAAGIDNLTVQQLKDIYINCQGTDNTTDLTQSTLRGVVNNWSQLPKSDGTGNGGNAPIIVWTSPNGSGERASFDTFLGGDSTSCIPAILKDNNLANGENVTFENDASPIRRCEDYVDAAGVSHAADTAAASCDGNRDGTRDPNATQESIYHTGYGAWFSWPSQDPYGKGAGLDLGKINGVAVSATTISDGTYLAKRNVYNVYRGNGFTTNPVNAQTYDYMSEEGWICNPDTTHVLDPKTGINYGTESSNVIDATGFVHFNPAPQTNQSGMTISSKCRVSNGLA